MKLVWNTRLIALIFLIAAPCLAQESAKLEGIVKDSTGKPVANVQVVVSVGSHRPHVDEGRIKDIDSSNAMMTDPSGRFSGRRPPSSFMLCAASDAGFGEVSWTEFDDSHEIVLQPWARIEGEVRRGTAPDLEFEVCIERGGWWNEIHPRIPIRLQVKPDDKGRFVFEKVPSAVIKIGRFASKTVETDKGETENWSCSDIQTLLPKPGETHHVTIGGKGRPVIGKLVAPAGFEDRIAFRGGDFAMLSADVTSKISRDGALPADWGRALDKQRKSSGYIDEISELRNYRVKVEPDGMVRVDDVPPGKYTLMVTVNFRDREPFGHPVGVASQPVVMPDVPGGYSPEPLDLGNLQVNLYDEFKNSK